MQSIDLQQAYSYLFEMQVNDDHTKQIWIHNAGGAIATMLIGQLPNSQSLIEKIIQQAEVHQVTDQLTGHVDRVKQLLQVQNQLNSGSELDIQKFFEITNGK